MTDMDISSRIQKYANAQMGIHKILGWLSVVSGLGLGVVVAVAPFKPEERGIVIGFGVLAGVFVIAGVLFIQVMAGRTKKAAALLIGRKNLSEPTVVEMRVNGRVFAFQAKFRDPAGRQHILKVPSESEARAILDYAMSGASKAA